MKLLPCKSCGSPGEVFVRVTLTGSTGRSEGWPWVQCDRSGPPCLIIQRRTVQEAKRDWNKEQVVAGTQKALKRRKDGAHKAPGQVQKTIRS